MQMSVLNAGGTSPELIMRRTVLPVRQRPKPVLQVRQCFANKPHEIQALHAGGRAQASLVTGRGDQHIARLKTAKSGDHRTRTGI